MKTTIYLSTGRGVSVITGSDRDWHGEVRLKTITFSVSPPTLIERVSSTAERSAKGHL